MKIAVVGNAPLVGDCGPQIDGSDIVVRFNPCPNYAVNTGTKTTALAVSNAGKPGRRMGGDVALFGFTHRGNSWHSWDAERRYVDEKIRQGLLRRGEAVTANIGD